MDIGFKPEHICLRTGDIYRMFYLKVIEFLKNEEDVKELCNQAIDIITDNIVGTYTNSVVNQINYNMLRTKGINTAGIVFINNAFILLCKNLMEILEQLNVEPTIDMTTHQEIYPYHFYKVFRGKIILKRL